MEKEWGENFSNREKVDSRAIILLTIIPFDFHENVLQRCFLRDSILLGLLEEVGAFRKHK